MARMIRHSLSLALVATALVSAQADKRLSADDVSRISGIQVHQVATGSVVGSGPGLNFAGPDNKMVLMVNFGTADMYRKAKAQKEMTVAGTTVPMVLFNKDVPGVGDEAFDSPPGKYQYVLYVRKGNQSISVTSYLRADTKPMLTVAQLASVATLILSRS